jgi:hypothetical protein
MTVAEAWRQYELAERRVDRSREAHDPTAKAIAEGQAAHWLAEYCAAIVRERRVPAGSTAMTTRDN